MVSRAMALASSTAQTTVPTNRAMMVTDRTRFHVM